MLGNAALSDAKGTNYIAISNVLFSRLMGWGRLHLV